MGEPSPGLLSSLRPPEDRLDSWKEIAAYLRRDVTTPEVYETYLKGQFALDSSDDSRVSLEKSIGYFEEAIRKDPTFAPAYLGIATAYAGTVRVLVVSSRSGAPQRDHRSTEGFGTGPGTRRSAPRPRQDAAGSVSLGRVRG